MMEKIQAWIEKHLVPVINKITSNFWFGIVADAVLFIVPFSMVSAIPSLWAILRRFVPVLPDISPLSTFSFGLIGLFVVFVIPYNCLQVMKGKLNRVVNEFRAKGKKINLEVLGVRPGCGDGDKTELKKWTSENAACIRQYYEGELDLGPYSTDANIPLSRNVLANTIGTVKGAGAHTRAEWVDLKSLPAGLGIVLSLMNRYLD